MKLTVDHLEAFVTPAPDAQAHFSVVLRGESGETYNLGGTLLPDAKFEDMLFSVAADIRKIRRRKPIPKYKVASIMPTTWGKSKFKILTAERDGSVTVRQVLSCPMKAYALGDDGKVHEVPIKPIQPGKLGKLKHWKPIATEYMRGSKKIKTPTATQVSIGSWSEARNKAASVPVSIHASKGRAGLPLCNATPATSGHASVFTYDPNQPYGQSVWLAPGKWTKSNRDSAKAHLLENARRNFPPEAIQRIKWVITPPKFDLDAGRGAVAWRIDAVEPGRKGKR